MKTERVETDVVCDRHGCGRRVTKKGGKMATINHRLITLTEDDDADMVDHVDLCRECLLQMFAMWARKAGDE